MIIGSSVEKHGILSSTNTYASLLLKKEHVQEGHVIVAGFQSEGKGHAINRWESESGKNLLISLILRPDIIQPHEQFLISIVISLGLTDFLKSLACSSSIKWPNDIYVNDDKIAGILIENGIIGDRLEHTIAGIGININQTRFSGAPNPVSLSLLTGLEHDLSATLNMVLASLDRRYKQLISGQWEELRNEYHNRLYKLNLEAEFQTDSRLFRGVIAGVDEAGLLLVRDNMGITNKYAHKEIEYIRPSPPSH